MSTEALLRRQLVLTWVAGLVALATMAAVALAVFLVPAVSGAWLVGGAVVSTLAMAAVLVVLLRHVMTLATFAFRKEPE